MWQYDYSVSFKGKTSIENIAFQLDILKNLLLDNGSPPAHRLPSFETRICQAREEVAQKKANMTKEDLEQLKIASHRHSEKVRDEIITSYELDKQRKATSGEEE